MDEPAHTPDPTEHGDAEGCISCYFIGVILSLFASTLQSLGQTFWRKAYVTREEENHIKDLKRLDQLRERGGHIDGATPCVSEDKISANEYSSDQSSAEGVVAHDALDASTTEHRGRVKSCDLVVWINNMGAVTLWVLGWNPTKRCPRKIVFVHQISSLFLLFALGNALDFVSLGITKQSVVTLVGSWCLTVNALTANCLLGEQVLALDWISMLLIIGGMVMTIVGSESSLQNWGLKRMIERYRAPEVVALLGTIAVAVFACFAIMRWDYVQRRRIARQQHGKVAPVSRAVGVLYCITGSLVATCTVLFGKAFSQLLVKSIDEGMNQFSEDPFSILIVAVFCITLPSQLILINASLAVNPVLMHIPTFLVFWNLGSCVAGGIFWKETESFTAVNWLLYVLGILLLVAGVVASNVAASRKQQQQQQQQLGEASRSLPAPGLAGGRGAGGSEPEAPSGSELYDISIAMQPGGAEAGGAARGKGSPHGALCEIAGAEKGGPREAGGSPLSGSGVAGLAPALAAAAGPGSLAGGEDRWF